MIKFLFKCLVVVVIMGFTTYSAHAAANSYFGGRSIFPIPCTGSGSTVPDVQWMLPLYMNSGLPLSGFMGVPYSISFLSYTILPGASALGYYTPGAASCIIGVCPYCTYIPNYGLILPYSGSSPL